MLGRSLPALALVVLAALGGCDSGSDEDTGEAGRTMATAPDRPPAGSRALVGRLRRGGFVITFRHAATDPSATDTTGDPRDCSRQRNLNARGRRQSREVGRAFRELDIPVGRVLASPFCRTRDTARLAFGRVRASEALLSPDFFSDDASGERQSSRLRRLLRQRPRAGTNTVLVSHAAAIGDATGVSLAEGEAAVVRPGEGRRGFEVVERVEAREWPSR
ncbi:MAG TPA: histidine phosphatase family protein [Thermoleophilaceae bacterium]